MAPPPLTVQLAGPISIMVETNYYVLDLSSVQAISTKSKTSIRTWTAINAVFDTYELREMILSRLHVPDLLVAAAVSKTWHAIITISKPALHGLHEWRPKSCPRYIIPYDLMSGPWFIHENFEWGTLFVRRVSGSQVIAFLPPGANTSPRIMDGKDMAITFTNHEAGSWGVKLQNLKTGISYNGEVFENCGRYPALFNFLKRLYGPPEPARKPSPPPTKKLRCENEEMMAKYGLQGRKWFW